MAIGNKTRVAIASLFVTATTILFTKPFEGGYVHKAYPDPGYGWKVPTICAGHTKGVKEGDVATDEKCERFLKEDLEDASYYVKICTNPQTKITQEQFDALVDFQFNTGAYCRSTLRVYVNEGQGSCMKAAAEFDKWVYSNKKKLGGLVKRRAANRALFEKGCVK